MRNEAYLFLINMIQRGSNGRLSLTNCAHISCNLVREEHSNVLPPSCSYSQPISHMQLFGHKDIKPKVEHQSLT